MEKKYKGGKKMERVELTQNQKFAFVKAVAEAWKGRIEGKTEDEIMKDSIVEAKINELINYANKPPKHMSSNDFLNEVRRLERQVSRLEKARQLGFKMSRTFQDKSPYELLEEYTGEAADKIKLQIQRGKEKLKSLEEPEIGYDKKYRSKEERLIERLAIVGLAGGLIGTAYLVGAVERMPDEKLHGVNKYSDFRQSISVKENTLKNQNSYTQSDGSNITYKLPENER